MKWMVWTEKTEEAECLVSSPLRVVLFLSRLVGMAPVWFRKQDKWRIRVSPVLCVLSYVIMTLLIPLIIIDVCTFTGLTFDLQEDISKAVRGGTNTRRACWAILVFLVMATASIGAYSGRNRMMVIIKGLDEIQKINKSLGSKYAPQRKEKRKNIAIVTSILIFLIVCISDYLNLLYDTFTNDKNVITVSLYSCYYIACLLMLMFMLYFIIIVQEVRTTLTSMNGHLNAILKTITTSGLENCTEVLLDQSTKTVDETIRSIYLKYGAVCNVIEKLNISNGPTVFIFLITSVAQLILSPYILVNNTSKLTSYYYLKMAQFVWSALHSIRIFLIIEPCHLTHREMARSSILISKLIITRTNEAISYELEKFARFLLLNQISYSPIGLCTLSRSFLGTIISGIVTYLVLMIQFQTEETM